LSFKYIEYTYSNCPKKLHIIFLIYAALFVFGFSNQACAESYLYEIEVPVSIGKNVTATDFTGGVHEIGKILELPATTRWPSYTASAWGKPGEICASAVNAIHVLISVEKNKGRTMSIIPKETIAPAAGPGASIVVSSKASEGIFGAWAPPVGSDVFVIPRGSSERKPFVGNKPPEEGDILIITVRQIDIPYMADIENRPGGRIIEWSKKGCSVIGRVIKPLAGTGRFEGTLFQSTGRLRANHCGVIDFSTSPKGIVGGFQIIPWDHALKSKEMQGSWDMTQWLIAGPADGKSMMGASFPLFRGALVPGPAENEKLWNIWSTYGRRSLLLVRINGGPWQHMPDSAGRQDYALKDITHLRIYFPFVNEPQK
jgi:hypothetical protein